MKQGMEEFVALQRELITLEHQEEVTSYENTISTNSPKMIEKMGNGIFNLVVSEHVVGMYGRHILSLSRSHGGMMGSSSISVGDIVTVGVSDNGTVHLKDSSNLVATHATVISVTPTEINVASDSLSRENVGAFKSLFIIKLPSDVTFRRMIKAIDNLAVEKNVSRLPVFDVLFGDKKADSVELIDDVKFFNQQLNESQRKTVVNCLAANTLSVIHGPPGTGKTTTVVELIIQEVFRGNKILACAPSNIAVDNIVERLLPFQNVKIVRLGHPARASELARQSTLDAKLLNSDYRDVIKALRADILKEKSLGKNVAGLKKDLRKYEERSMFELLESCDVVVSTCASAHESGPLRHIGSPFDVCVIDESGQAVEVECWIPVMRCKKVVLAGDHMQLPPTIMSDAAASRGLKVTLLERQVELHPDIVNLLDIQYRMNHAIMKWSSDQFYKGRLKCASDEVSNRAIIPPTEESIPEVETPLMLIDTCNSEMRELDTPNEESKGNEAEADLAAYHVRLLIKTAGVPETEIAVITPYNLQIQLMRDRLLTEFPKLEIRSVDGFQGREKDAVVISLVRSNVSREIGFLSEARRLNVAVTRAKKHVCIIGDSHTLSASEELRAFIKYIEDNGIVASALDYADKEDMIWSSTYQPKYNNPENLKPDSTSKSKRTVPQNPKFFDRRELSRQLDTFEESKLTELAFSPTLPGAARAFIHDQAEKRNLEHISCGKGKKRFVVLRKRVSDLSRYAENLKPTSHLSSEVEDMYFHETGVKPFDLVSEEDSEVSCQSECDEEEHLIASLNLESSTVNAQEGEPEVVAREITPASADLPRGDSTVCTTCMGRVPLRNLDLHLLQCTKRPLSSSKPVARTEAPATKPKRVNPLEKVKGVSNFDDICDTFKTINSKCDVHKCGQSILSLRFDCNYCSGAFCSDHRCPESHGCSRKDVKRIAKAAVGKPPVKIDQAPNAALHGKMKKKLQSMQNSRAPQKKK